MLLDIYVLYWRSASSQDEHRWGFREYQSLILFELFELSELEHRELRELSDLPEH